jgi:mono/diheme cytochrome c family protein
MRIHETVLAFAALTAVAPAAPADDKKASLLADERAAFDKAKPVFDKYCAGCHAQGGKQATKKKLDHFEMTSYPFGGHHVATLGPTIRKVLAIEGGKATMPYNKPGSVTGDDLAAIAGWVKAWDAAQAAGVHPDASHHDHHDHHDHDHD